MPFKGSPMSEIITKTLKRLCSYSSKVYFTLTALSQSAAHSKDSGYSTGHTGASRSKDSGISTGHTGASSSAQLPTIPETESSQLITKSTAQPGMSEDSTYGSQQSLKSRKL